MSLEATRPRSHDGTSAIEQQIFAATERLLADISARDLSVERILAEAGVSRGSFYHYFESKWQVVNTLARALLEAIYERVQPFVSPGAEAPEEALRRSIVEGCCLWAEHRAVARAIMEHWREVPELRGMWLDVMGEFSNGIAATIDREREKGRIMPGVDAQRLATSLMWSTAQCLYIAGLEEIKGLPDEASARESLTALWIGALYGRPSELSADSGQAS